MDWPPAAPDDEAVEIASNWLVLRFRAAWCECSKENFETSSGDPIAIVTVKTDGLKIVA
ncbi:MAG: hypothetical protein WDN46_06620 [Methylocella sp.]